MMGLRRKRARTESRAGERAKTPILERMRPLMLLLGLAFSWAPAYFYGSGLILAGISVLFLRAISGSRRHRKAGLLAVFVPALAAIYFGAVPMYETIFVMSLVPSAYYFYKYLATSNLFYLVISSSFVGFSSMVWHPGWVLAPFFLVVLLIKLMLEDGGLPSLKHSGVRKFLSKRRHKIEGISLVYSLPAFAGIAGVVIWNFMLAGSPPDFLAKASAIIDAAGSSIDSAYSDISKLAFADNTTARNASVPRRNLSLARIPFSYFDMLNFYLLTFLPAPKRTPAPMQAS